MEGGAADDKEPKRGCRWWNSGCQTPQKQYDVLVSSISVSFTSTLTSALLLSSYLLLTFPSTLPQTGLLLSSLTLSSLTAANFVFEEM